ncbi:hypothetical protein H311_03084 [Anncaliia algerae PRA109]|uniref:Uncharacterized protein n=1 Tax=Anncaliia algerae PRA339 TaxID=1288291 RepID=A0A059EXK1_9MICR|nr:hypothetical protein H311_03084 [Anncaliia algerae PRA109]KCZ79567.1 hypothetical protein H312_03039 [Anncaliia algerae PRA339]
MAKLESDSNVNKEAVSINLGNNITEKSKENINKEIKNKENISRKKDVWTKEQSEELIKLVAKIGAGYWNKIRADSQTLEGKSALSLKDKHRLISKQTSYYKTTPKEWIEVTLDGELVGEVGDCKIVNARFPHDAAKVIAKRKESPKEECVVSVTCDKGITIHSYNVSFLGSNKFKLTKIKRK